jgi:hypothetical protein
MSLYEFFKDAHSGFRYVLLLLVLFAIIQSLVGWLGNRPYSDGNRKINMFAMISADIQLLLGIVLYFLSPLVQFNSGTMKNDTTRYFTVEHWVMMLIAIALIHVGYSKSKKAVLPEKKHKSIAIFYIIAILVIIGALLAGKLPIFGNV